MAELRQPPSIEAFGAGGFRISGRRHEGSVLILADVAADWGPATVTSLAPEDFVAVIARGASQVEFVLLGSGPATAPAPRGVREALQRAGLGLEVMSTPEACRLYNVLASDGRQLAAALLPV